MSKQNVNNFNFWCPVEISKAIDETTGEEIMLLGGIASTADEDSDGEFLDPKGFDIKPLVESGMVNWHHQAKTCPATIVGEPTKAEIRKDGLYIETKLYPSSQVARDIWELAQTLDRDSKTRRLGYSIEGKVLERKSDNPKSPDYKKISKAIITGVAITHQPKNPKTFANIIKGEIDELDEEEDEKEDNEEKSLDTTVARPLIKEELDPKIKNQTFGKSEVIEKLFQDIPGISIEKAKKIYDLIKNISTMAKRKIVTEEDITKAYDALGLERLDINKAEDSDTDENSDIDDEEDDEEEDIEKEEEEEKVKKAKTKKTIPSKEDFSNTDDEEEEEEDEEEEDEEEEEEDDDTEDKEDDVAEKAQIFNRFDRIEKALATSHLNNTRYIKALGVLVKDQSENLTKAISALELANDKIDDLSEINKAQSDEIESLRTQIEAFGNSTPSPKSVRSVAAVERNFAKSNQDELNDTAQKSNQIRKSDKNAVLDILDQATFAKGFDAEFSKACTDYEASGYLTPQTISRIKTEFGIEIV